MPWTRTIGPIIERRSIVASVPATKPTTPTKPPKATDASDLASVPAVSTTMSTPRACVAVRTAGAQSGVVR
jgi:hypothetical protein